MNPETTWTEIQPSEWPTWAHGRLSDAWGSAVSEWRLFLVNQPPEPKYYVQFLTGEFDSLRKWEEFDAHGRNTLCRDYHWSVKKDPEEWDIYLEPAERYKTRIYQAANGEICRYEVHFKSS